MSDNQDDVKQINVELKEVKDNLASLAQCIKETRQQTFELAKVMQMSQDTQTLLTGVVENLTHIVEMMLQMQAMDMVKKKVPK